MYPDRAFARAIELAKKDRLPASQLQCRVLDGQGLTRATHQGFDVRGGVAFLMLISVFVRHQFIERLQNVAHHIRVITFLNHDGGGRVRRVNYAKATLDAAICDNFLHFSRDVDELVALFGGQMKLLHARYSNISCNLRLWFVLPGVEIVQNIFDVVENEPFYQIIQKKYQGKVARRSGVSYMNHIKEGVVILDFLYGYEQQVIEAYCLHPIFQSDKSLSEILNEDDLSLISRRALVLAMEYRRIANAYTIKNKVRKIESIDIGLLPQVHQMLVADKIQNKKDFMKYIFRKHERPSYQRVSERTVQYFDSWLARLNVDEATYQKVTAHLKEADFFEANNL